MFPDFCGAALRNQPRVLSLLIKLLHLCPCRNSFVRPVWQLDGVCFPQPNISCRANSHLYLLCNPDLAFFVRSEFQCLLHLSL